jgi:hypothetical protein
MGGTMDQVRRWRRASVGGRPGPAGLPRQCGALSQGDLRPNPGGERALQEEESRGLRRASTAEVRLPGRREALAPTPTTAGAYARSSVSLLMRLVKRFDRDEQAETLYDYAAKRLQSVDGVVLSKIKGRIDSQEMPTILRVIGDVGTGEFDGFEASIAGEEHTSDEALTIRAFDLTKARSDSILGRQPNLIELLPCELKDVSAAISMGNFERVANAPAAEIAHARDDVKNSLAIALNLYEAPRWIYGDGAFGLRLAATVARKPSDGLLNSMILLMFRLREVPGAIRPSGEIAELAKQAGKLWLFSKGHEWRWLNHPSFSKILHPKRIKSAFADEIALKQWQRELNAIIVQATGKTPTGSNNDGQEVGKSH